MYILVNMRFVNESGAPVPLTDLNAFTLERCADDAAHRCAFLLAWEEPGSSVLRPISLYKLSEERLALSELNKLKAARVKIEQLNSRLDEIEDRFGLKDLGEEALG